MEPINDLLPNDKSRFNAILNLLPEKFVEDWVDFLWNANYPIGYTEAIGLYDDYRKKIMSEFTDLKTNDLYKKLNEAFADLKSFLDLHFYVPQEHYKMHNNPPFFYLEPRVHHNFRLSEGGQDSESCEKKDSREWNKYKNELEKLAKNFKLAYKDFIATAKEKIEMVDLPRSPVQEIKINEMPELKIKGFEEKVILQKPKNKRLQLRVFPKDLKWKEVTIRFLNEHEVIITARNDTFQIDYNAMGFQDEKRKLPNRQWVFLKGLSELNGEITWKNPKATLQGKKQKQLLADGLKSYFQINEDPFYPYKNTIKSYKIKINLMPEANSATNTDGNNLDIEEYRKEQSPMIYKK